jgi:hypothetical protein
MQIAPIRKTETIYNDSLAKLKRFKCKERARTELWEWTPCAGLPVGYPSGSSIKPDGQLPITVG